MRKLLSFAASALRSVSAPAQTGRGFDDSASNLMVVLRESEGVNIEEEALIPIDKARFLREDGSEIEFNPGWFSYVGDMHIRFMFDAPATMHSASPADLERLGLSPPAALQLALKNIKRVYGEPHAIPWSDLFQVQGRSPDLDSSYFLDKDFWNAREKEHPEGLVALVAKRGGLLFAPLSDARAVANMRRTVAYLHSSSEMMRISSALYLFKDGKWSVFQPAVGAKVSLSDLH